MSLESHLAERKWKFATDFDGKDDRMTDATSLKVIGGANEPASTTLEDIATVVETYFSGTGYKIAKQETYQKVTACDGSISKQYHFRNPRNKEQCHVMIDHVENERSSHYSRSQQEYRDYAERATDASFHIYRVTIHAPGTVVAPDGPKEGNIAKEVAFLKTYPDSTEQLPNGNMPVYEQRSLEEVNLWKSRGHCLGICAALKKDGYAGRRDRR